MGRECLGRIEAEHDWPSGKAQHHQLEPLQGHRAKRLSTGAQCAAGTGDDMSVEECYHTGYKDSQTSRQKLDMMAYAVMPACRMQKDDYMCL